MKRSAVRHILLVALVARAGSAAAQLPDPAQFADRGFGIDSRRRGSGSSLLAARLPAGQRRNAQRVFDDVLVALSRDREQPRTRQERSGRRDRRAGGRLRGGSHSKSSTSGRPWIVTSTKGWRAAGTYAIDGFTLTLRRDDGQVEHHGIVTHPTNSYFIWVDGVQYERDP